jgi:hypothetical protein
MLKKLGSQLTITAASLSLDEILSGKPVPASEATTSGKVIESKKDDFVYFRARAISALDQGPVKGQPNPNGNGDGFPRAELEKSFETFIGRNLFLNHESDHPVKSIGKIIDAKQVEDPETGEYYIECLSKIDKKLHPEIARKVETGELDKVSMGCSCEASKCSICGTEIHTDADQKCTHLANGLLKEFTAEVDMPEYGIKKGTPTKAFAINTGLTFNELSIVNVPADSRAVIKTILSNINSQLNKKASLDKEAQAVLVASIDKVIAELDEKTRDEVKAAICACPTKEASPMPENKSNEQAELDEVLKKLNALDYMRLRNSIEKKELKLAAASTMTAVAAPAPEPRKEDSFMKAVIEKAKKTFAGKMFAQTVKRIAADQAKPIVEKPVEKPVIPPTVRAEFKENKEAVLASTWSIYEGDKAILTATLKDIWAGEFELMPFEDQKDGRPSQKLVTSEAYGQALVARYLDKEEGGLDKVAELLGVKADVKNSKVEMPSKGDFVKPGEETKADKEAVKSEKALDKVDSTEVGTHLEKSTPDGKPPVEAAKVEPAVEKKADGLGEPPASPVEEPKLEEKPLEAPIDAPIDAPKPEEALEDGSAFDKLDAPIVIGEGYEATKDKESKEIIINKDGKEFKRLPDGFGDDVAEVMKLLRAVLGLPAEEAPKEDGALPKPEDIKPTEEPKVDAPMQEQLDVKEEVPNLALSSQVEKLKKQAEELAAKEAELVKAAAKVEAERKQVNAARLTAAVSSRAAQCRKIVDAMFEKDMLVADEATINSALEAEDADLLTARNKGLEVAASRQVRKLMAMDDKSLKAFEESVDAVQKVEKRASKLPHINWTPDLTEDTEIAGIFGTMGNGGGIRSK